MNKLTNLTRRQIRYVLFRLMTEADGGAKANKEKEGNMKLVDEIRDHFETQDDFGGWSKFAKTWDVDEKAPLVAVLRTSSINSDWNNSIKGTTAELPVSKKKKKLLTNKLAQVVQRTKRTIKRKRARFDI